MYCRPLPTHLCDAGVACRTSERCAVSGILLDRQGSYVRGKVSKQWDIVKPILRLIEQGREWEELGKHPWRSLEEMAEAHPMVVDAMYLLNCTTYPSLWRLLRQAQPGLRKSVMLIKGSREPVQAQQAARQILGWDPMVFVARVHNAHPRTRRVLDGNYVYHYKYEQLEDNVYIDAGKAEPKKWVMSQRVITSSGYTQRALTSALIMKSVSSLKIGGAAISLSA